MWYSYFNSGSHFVQLIRTDWEILQYDLIVKPSCDLFLNWDHWLERICHLEIFLIYSSGSQLVWRSKVINLKVILLESIMSNISAKLFCICTSAEFHLSFQIVEILTLQVSLAEIYSFNMLLNSNMIFWTPILEYLKTISLQNLTLPLSQPVTAR